MKPTAALFGAALLALTLAAAGCAGVDRERTGQPSIAIPREHHAVMQRKAEAFCARFDAAPVLVGWRYRSTYGKRGMQVVHTIWACRPAPD